MKQNAPANPGGEKPPWISENRRLIRRVGLWALTVLVPLPIVAGFVAWGLGASAQSAGEIGLMAGTVSFGGLLALFFTDSHARHCRRPLNNHDAVRMVSWVFVGAGLCSACSFNPLAMPMVLGGLVAIGLSLVLEPHPPGTCFNCGYDLTGNMSGICPECGEAI